MEMENNMSVPEEQVSKAEDVTMDPTQETTACEAVSDNLSAEESVSEDAAPETDKAENAPEEPQASEPADEDDGLDIESLAGKTKEELLEILRDLVESKPVQSIRKGADAIKVAFYRIHNAEVDEQRRAYEKEGGDPESFTPAYDSLEGKLKSLFAAYRQKRQEYVAGMEKIKEENLQKKLSVIEELKELLQKSEMAGSTYSKFRELQQRWKEIGIVPQEKAKEIWETYSLHVENFYNYIRINKELKDLDLQKNLEMKQELCEQAEALAAEPSVVNAFRKLQTLHEQWKEIGPVAAEHKEAVWERFREASTRINKLHQDYFEKIKDEQKHNLDLKSQLCDQAEELLTEPMTSRKEWTKASEKLMELQKVWKTIGFAPKKDNNKIYERFRSACDSFFEKKRSFFEDVKSEMDINLQLKNEICEKAEALKDSEQWKKATEELKELQKRWKEIGPVARKQSDAVWKRFRAACDSFFERKAGHFADVDSEHDDNLARKNALLDEMEQADIEQGGFDMIKDFQQRWNEIGFVPIKEKEAVQKRYRAIMDDMYQIARGNSHAGNMERFRDKLTNIRTAGDKKIRIERDRLYNKLKQVEMDVATLENNIGFFSKSKNAEALISGVRDKIEKAKQEMAELVEKINLIDSKEN